MAEYQQSVPALMCRYWYGLCTNATIGANGEGNSAEQYACLQAQNENCGNKTTNDASTTSATTSGSSSPSSTGSDSGSSAQQSGSATSSAATGASSTPGAAVRLAQEFGAPVLAGGMIALFGIAL